MTTRGQRKQLRQLASKAEAAELAAALDDLYQHFHTWKSGEVDAFELQQLIHVFYHDKARKIYKRYQDPDGLSVARALKLGLIEQSDVPEQLLDVVGQLTELLETAE